MAISAIINNPTAFVYVAPPPSDDLPGEAWVWGNNSFGQLGVGDTTQRLTPVMITGHSFSRLAGCEHHSLALKADGTLWAWGRNANGQLGDNTTTNRSAPIQIGTQSFKRINAGGTFSNALDKNDGSAWGWGSNNLGQLGDNTNTNRSTPVSTVGGHSFIDISGGYDFNGSSAGCIALKADGSVWGWGNNNFGQVGDGTSTSRQSPVSVVGGHSFTKIAANGITSYAIRGDGTLWAWGINDQGQMTISGGGAGTGATHNSPVEIGFGLTTWIDVSCEWRSMMAIKSDGTVWACGYNQSGSRLGVNSVAAGVSTFTQVITAQSFTNIAMGQHDQAVVGHTLARKSSDGSLWAWGDNSGGCLGDNTGTARSSPTSVFGAHSFAAVYHSGQHSLAKKL